MSTNILSNATPLALTQDNGNIYVILYVGTSYKLYKSTDGGSTWAQVGVNVPSPTANIGQKWGLAVDGSGNIHVAYGSDAGATFNLYHRFYNGSTWSAEVTVSGLTVAGAGGIFQKSYIDLKRTGTKLIIVISAEYTALGFAPDIGLYSFVYTAGSWDGGTQLDTGHLFNGSSLAIDSSNDAYVSYLSMVADYTHKKLYFLKKTGASWSAPELVTASENWGFTKIDVDSSNVPHILAQHFSGGWKLEHVYKSGAWTIEDVDTIAAFGDETGIIATHSASSKRGAVYYKSNSSTYATTLATDYASIKNHIQSTLASNINKTQTTIGLVSTAHFPSSDGLYLEAIVRQNVLGADITSDVTTISVDSATSWPTSGHGYVETNGNYAQDYTTVSIALNEMPITVTLHDATNFPVSGSAYIGDLWNQDFIQWTGKSGNVLTGVTWPWAYNGIHDVNDRVDTNYPGIDPNYDYFEYTGKTSTSLTGVTWPYGRFNDHFIGEHVDFGGPYDYDYCDYTGKSGNNLTGCTNRNFTNPAGTIAYSPGYYYTNPTTLDVADASGLTTSGTATIGSGGGAETFTYTGKSGNTLTGVSGIANSHFVGENVSQGPTTTNNAVYNPDTNSDNQLRFLWIDSNTLYERKKNGSFNTTQTIDTGNVSLSNLLVVEVMPAAPPVTSQSRSWIQYC